MKNLSTKNMVLSALGIALVFLATYLIKVPNGIQGYFNLGDGFIFLFASILHPFLAFLIGGVGSGLADIAGGYGIYFIPTLCIKGLEAVLVSYLMNRYGNRIKYVAYSLGSSIMILGYFVVDAYVNQSWQLSLTGIPSNLLQACVGIAIASLCYPILKKRNHL